MLGFSETLAILINIKIQNRDVSKEKKGKMLLG
jgi:hypothetical protein